MSSNATQGSTNNNRYTDKLSRKATVLTTLSMLPIAAQAGVVHVNTSLTISIEDARVFNYTPVDWDVDGDSVADFRLEAFRTIVYSGSGYGGSGYGSYGFSRPYGNLQLNSGGLNGQGMVQTAGDSADSIRNLAPGDTVGPALGAGQQWGPSNQNRTMMVSSSYFGFASGSLFGPGNLIGFSFLNNGGQTLYGWAEVSVDDGFALSLTIEQWAYEDNGGSIEVGQISSVPVPPAFLTMLSGLALGAGGVLRGRKVRKAAALKADA